MIKRIVPLLLLAAVPLFADGPKDNLATEVRPVPPPGIAVPAEVKAKIEAGIKQLRAAIDEAAKAQAKNPLIADLLPDVEIYHKALDWALRLTTLVSLPAAVGLATLAGPLTATIYGHGKFDARDVAQVHGG